MTKTEILLKQKTRKENKQKRNKIILTIVCFTLLGGGLHSKANSEKVCKIISTQNNIIRIQHPDNNYQYDIIVDDIENYYYQEYAVATFNELTDWNKNFSVKKIKPYDK